MAEPSTYDVLVIGAGMGGLLAACRLARAGKRVLLAEKLSFLGGRFSGFKVGEIEIPTGAFHTIPHGDKGPFSQALRRSGVELEISKPRVFASFHLNGEQIIAHNPFQVLKAFRTFRERVLAVKGLLLSWFVKDFQGSYGDWLESLRMSAEAIAVYDRFCQFSLSTTIRELPYSEGRKVTEMIFKYGVPGVPRGGAREVSRQLGLAARRAGVEIRQYTRVQQLILKEGRVSGAVLFDRQRNIEYRVDRRLPNRRSDLRSRFSARKAWSTRTGSCSAWTHGELPVFSRPAIWIRIWLLLENICSSAIR
ncbi:MAG: FAD-dependent oxidoreductase [Anaerolineales bacterium]